MQAETGMLKQAKQKSASHHLLKQQGKIIKHLNERTEFTESKKLGSEIFKMSVNVELTTSSALTPYYSLELNLLSSTSHPT